MTFKVGTSGSNTLTGSDLADFLFGLAGNDTLAGGKGNDLLDGGYGDDTFKVGSGNAIVRGGPGDDTLNLAAGDWFIAPLGYASSVRLVDQDTGQTVELSEIETLNIGSETFRFVCNPDDVGQALIGTDSTDYIFGRDGDDTIQSGDGNDWVKSGNGSDTIETGAGNDIVDARNLLNRNEVANETTNIDAGSGDDVIVWGLRQSDAGVETRYSIDGGADTDVVYLDDRFLSGVISVAEDEITVTRGNLPTQELATLINVEQVVALSSDIVWTLVNGSWIKARQVQSLTGTAMSEDIKGTAGNDTLRGGGGFDRFFGGQGTDTVVLSGRPEQYAPHLLFTRDGSFYQHTKDSFSGVHFANELDPRNPGFAVGSDVEKLKFSNATYSYKSGSINNMGSLASTGNDFIVVDEVSRRGTYSLALGKGNDLVWGVGDVTKVDGGEGNDHITWQGFAKKAQFLGGDGKDSVSVVGNYETDSTVTVDGGRGNDTLDFRANLVASARIIGGDGDDTIFVSAVGATTMAGDGNDAVKLDIYDLDDDDGISSVGSADGGRGDDLLILDYAMTDYRFEITKTGYTVTYFEWGSAQISNFEAVKFDLGTLSLKDLAFFNGTKSADTQVGGRGADFMHGMNGNDTLDGGKGNDILAGDYGKDILSGGDGDDIIDGGRSGDTLTGGKGHDQFFFRTDGFGLWGYKLTGNDVITDFQAGKGFGDVLVFELGKTQFDSFHDMMSHATQTADGTLFNWGNDNTLLVKGVSIDKFVADDFLFL